MARMKRKSRADWGAFSINDGYTQKEKIMMANQLMQQNGKAPTMHLAMLLLMDGHQLRPHAGFALGTVTDQGKVNRNGREEFAWIMSHKDPLQCGIGAVLRRLLWRYEFLDNHQYPDFSSRDDWYDQHLFYGRDREKELSYVTHLSFLSKLFQDLGIMSRKKTHAPRGSGARDSCNLNVDLKDIAMLGKWSNEHIVKSYFNGIPLSAVLARAGFQNHVHLIPRTTVKADQELLDMPFPGVEQRHNEQVEHNKHSIRQGEKDAVDLAAAHYLEFLKEGRKAILEDAAILQDKYPKHRIFNLPCFKLPQNDSARTALQQKWAEYKAEVIAAHARSVDENIEVEENNLCMVTKNALLQQQNQHLQEKLETQRQQQLHQQQQLLTSQQEATKFSDERQTLLATISRLIAGGPAQTAGAASFSHRQGTAGTSSAAQAPSTTRAGASGEEYVRCSIPMEPVSGSLTSILSCWKEYKYSTAERPSIRRLIDDHGTDWHSSKYKYHRKKWNLKKRIISAVEAIQSIKQMSSEEAVNSLETMPRKSPSVLRHSTGARRWKIDAAEGPGAASVGHGPLQSSGVGSGVAGRNRNLLARELRWICCDISQRSSWQAAFADATVRQAAKQMRQRPTRPKAVSACKCAYDCRFAAAVNLLHRDSL
ncbi:hypothetical protein WJX82_004373 [Trebouxia sp. C0006]